LDEYAAIPSSKLIFSLRSTASLATMLGTETILSYRHRAVTTNEVIFIRELIAEDPAPSRRDLSKKLWQAWNWVQADGALRDMECHGLMLQLHREGHIELSPSDVFRKSAGPARPTGADRRRDAAASFSAIPSRSVST
jgi:hypothetical protein